MNEKSIAEIETLIESHPDELERYLVFAKGQEELDRENLLAALLYA